MFSSYYDDDNQLILKRNIVVFNYLKSWFIVDITCCIPLDSISGAILNSGSSTNSSS